MRGYSFMFFLAFLSGWILMNLFYRKERIETRSLDSLFIYTVLGTIIGARFGHILFYNLIFFKNHCMEAFFPVWENPKEGYEFIGYRGLSSHGAAIGLIISNWLYSKRIIKKPFLWISDRICIPITLGGVFVRIGNFFNYEIVGKPTDLPWAVKFIKMDREYGKLVPRHPTQLYESLADLCIFFILLLIFHNKKQYLGYITGLFFILLWSVRFIIEFVKEPQGREILHISILNTGQLLSIPFIILGFFIMGLEKICQYYEHYKRTIIL
ncbi:prolipoprotein diacylglyceryl transferase [Candidatus Walczuchella monophlebidarum]|nr:prolipoprotein diacylglyceryl transferase [Candidatus Walczuchella monophlebidarum]